MPSMVFIVKHDPLYILDKYLQGYLFVDPTSLPGKTTVLQQIKKTCHQKPFDLKLVKIFKTTKKVL
jgi:hypothetical protein